MTSESGRPAPAADPFTLADLAVAAQRTFNAALRTARGARIPPAQALRAANEFTLRKIGVDWLEELGLADEINDLAPLEESATITGRNASNVAEFVEALVAGELAPLKMMPGLTSRWFDAYCAWCDSAARQPVSLKRFVYELDHSHAYRTARKGFMAGGVRTNPRSFLYFGVTPPRGRIESEWLGEQVRACDEMFSASGLVRH